MNPKLNVMAEGAQDNVKQWAKVAVDENSKDLNVGNGYS